MTKRLIEPWKILEEQIYQEFHLFTARRSRRVNPRTGKYFDFFLMNGLNWVTMICFTASDEVILVDQYRHGADTRTIELPGGAIEPGEEPMVCAQRELLEETGYQAKNWQSLGVLFPNPAMQGMRLHAFMAEEATLRTTQTLDPGEDIEVKKVSRVEFFEMVRDGRINHALCVAAAGLYLINQGPGSLPAR